MICGQFDGLLVERYKERFGKCYLRHDMLCKPAKQCLAICSAFQDAVCAVDDVQMCLDVIVEAQDGRQ